MIPYKRRELDYMCSLAKKFHANIAILYVAEDTELNEVQTNNKALLEDILNGVDYKFYTLSNSDVTTAVNIFTESRESDLVAFINKKHAFFGSIFTNPMVKEISFQSKVPILVMHDFKN